MSLTKMTAEEFLKKRRAGELDFRGIELGGSMAVAQRDANWTYMTNSRYGEPLQMDGSKIYRLEMPYLVLPAHARNLEISESTLPSVTIEGPFPYLKIRDSDFHTGDGLPRSEISGYFRSAELENVDLRRAIVKADFRDATLDTVDVDDCFFECNFVDAALRDIKNWQRARWGNSLYGNTEVSEAHAARIVEDLQKYLQREDLLYSDE